MKALFGRRKPIQQGDPAPGNGDGAAGARAAAHAAAGTRGDAEGAVSGTPGPAGRSAARRRLRRLERIRELLLRDLGGLVYEVQRRGRPEDRERHQALVAEKVARLEALRAEAEALAAALGSPYGERVVREPGIGGACARCGELAGSDARYCSRCGAPLGRAETPVAAPGARARVTAWSQPGAPPPEVAGSGGGPEPPEASAPGEAGRTAELPARPGAGS